MESELYLLYLDRFHMSDLLFMQSLARAFGRARGTAPPCVIVHGGGEQAARRLEAEGFFPEQEEDGRVKVASPGEAALVEQAVRAVNRKLVGLLTDAVVHALGVQGADRNLLRRVNGTVQAHRAGWIRELAQKGVVPVVSALARDAAGTVQEVKLADAAVALARAFEPAPPRVVFFSKDNRLGLQEGAALRLEVGASQLPGEALPEPEALRVVLGADVPGLLTSVDGLLGEAVPRGTRIRP